MSYDKFIERRIVTGAIISTDYLTKLIKVWNSRYLLSKELRSICVWCLDYYKQYQKAPGRAIEDIYLQKARKMKKAQTDLIEDLLVSLSDEYEREDKFNVDFLFDETTEYFQERSLKNYVDDITTNLANNEIERAKALAEKFNPIGELTTTDLDLSSKEAVDKVALAFKTADEPLIKYPKHLGAFLNSSLVRGGFVAFLAPEKRGKTWLLLDMAIRAVEQGSNVAFFQSGDMTEDQQLKRISIRLAKKSDKEKYTGEQWEPTRDCIHNQMDTCVKKERESDTGLFEGVPEETIRRELNKQEIIDAVSENPEYKPCHNCVKYRTARWGVPCYTKVDIGGPLTAKEAQKHVKKFTKKYSSRFMLSTHPQDTLKVSHIDAILERWKREHGFIPDVILIDYADILAAESGQNEFRNQENKKWQGLRKLSQKQHALVITATQADAGSYTVDTITLKNFSEDKRKYAHVTAMYSLNQDKAGREKELGLMRINQLVIREDEFSVNNYVTVLQNLSRGQPCMQSFF